MKITVTKRDIKLGLKATCSNTLCPVARALRRAGFRGISVGVNLMRNGKGNDIKVPYKVYEAIERMCETSTMEPFTFTLTARQVRSLKRN